MFYAHVKGPTIALASNTMFKVLMALSLLSIFNRGPNLNMMYQPYCAVCQMTTTYRGDSQLGGLQNLNSNLNYLDSRLSRHLDDLNYELPGLIAEKTRLTTSYYMGGLSPMEAMRLNQIDQRIGEMQGDSAYLRSYGASLAGQVY